MEILTLVALLVFGAYILKSRDQRQRIALLGSHLARYQIETLMESLTQGYLRCLGEDEEVAFLANLDRLAGAWSAQAS